jgi:hypothetical protein
MRSPVATVHTIIEVSTEDAFKHIVLTSSLESVQGAGGDAGRLKQIRPGAARVLGLAPVARPASRGTRELLRLAGVLSPLTRAFSSKPNR